MIRKLKIKFIILAMTAVCLLLGIVVTGMNLINYSTVVAEADTTLELLSQNEGSFPMEFGGRAGLFREPMSQELPYESRYFSVLYAADGRVILTDTGKIASVDSQSAVEYAQKVMDKGGATGFIDDFRYRFCAEGSDTRVIFLDCGRKLQSFHTFLYASIAMTMVGIVAVFFVIFFFAGRITAPIAQSYEKQKQFITNAGHELKTPLTIINANVDVLEMELGEDNECLEDIQQQTRRLTALTNDLVMLARMEEGTSAMQMVDFPVSEVVSEAVMAFRTPAQTRQKVFIYNIQPDLSLYGDACAVEQLVNILMENALKYAPEGGVVRLDMVRMGKVIRLSVCNSTQTTIPAGQLDHVFERFYRPDVSRNSETGGHGIGLSVAQAIVAAHGGRIQATVPAENTFQITVTLPS